MKYSCRKFSTMYIFQNYESWLAVDKIIAIIRRAYFSLAHASCIVEGVYGVRQIKVISCRVLLISQQQIGIFARKFT